METLTVLYDSGCSLCQWATRWLISKPKLVDMNFVPAGSGLARSMFPTLITQQRLVMSPLSMIKGMSFKTKRHGLYVCGV